MSSTAAGDESKDQPMEDAEPQEKEEAKTLEADKVIERNLALIEKAVSNGTTRSAMRALRLSTQLRKHLTTAELAGIVRATVPDSASVVEELLSGGGSSASSSMEVEEPESSSSLPPSSPSPSPLSCLPEVEVYLVYLAAAVLCREKKFEGAARVTSATLPRLKEFQGRRTLEPLGAKIYFYFCLAHEKLGEFDAMRPTLLAAHRTACIQRDEYAQAVLLNAVVRGLLKANRVDSAFKLVSKTTFPETVSNNQFCRYLYYTGRVAAVQLDYTDAYTKLMQSMRKAPANAGLGFRRAVHQLAVLVQLLMGELPLRSAFEGPGGLTKILEPYLKLAVAVRRGSLAGFNDVLAANADRFKKDTTYTFALRLAPNVVKTGLRQINISYSRISLDDVTAKLQLESARSTEFVIAKAIKDGVIDATLDHDNGWMCSKDVADVYATDDPQKAFHRRIAFCLDVHNEALKAMIYPPDASKKQPGNEEKKDPDQNAKTDEERAKEIEDELGDDGL